jgi:hypothetical protein
MYRIDDATAATTLPVPEAALTEGYWTEGNPGTGTPATLERASWFNMVQEELRAIPVAAGLTPSKTAYNQILTALKSMFPSVVGSARNLSMYVATASATATLTAAEIVVETVLGGQTFRLASFNKTINLATIGAGGMDTGTAPVSGFVALYAIYNPVTATAALLATNAATLQGDVYSGANMPTGYTASALVSVVPTNGSKQIVALKQNDRFISIQINTLISTGSLPSTPTPISASSIIPVNAKSVVGANSIGINANGNFQLQIGADTNLSGQQLAGITTAVASGGNTSGNYALQLVTPQTIYYATVGSGSYTSVSTVIYISGYGF